MRRQFEKTETNLFGDGREILGELKALWRRDGGPLTANYRWTWVKRAFILPVLK